MRMKLPNGMDLVITKNALNSELRDVSVMAWIGPMKDLEVTWLSKTVPKWQMGRAMKEARKRARE